MNLRLCVTTILAFGFVLSAVSGELPAQECETISPDWPTENEIQNFDGSCNNLQHPSWGAVGKPHPRMIPADYDDTTGNPRIRENGRELPPTRKISNMLKDARPEESSAVSHMHVLFGQLLAHDIVHTPIVKKPDGTKLDCDCEKPHPECINLPIGKDDEQFLLAGKTCMKLARSRPAKGTADYSFPQREQTNALSSVIDATFVYGKTKQEAIELRDPDSDAGELKTKENPIGGPHKLLPTQDMLNGTGISKTTDCPIKVHKPVGKPCFVAGDIRNNENTGLVSIQTVWMRHHNILARRLKSLNPHWTSDQTYFETRRIVAAQAQIVTYNEYVPPLIGAQWMKAFDLELAGTGYWNGYDDKYNPAITNEFTTAAFRYGHSQVAPTLSRLGTFFQKGLHTDIPSEKSFFNSEPLLNRTGGGVGSLMRGFMVDKADRADPTLTDALRNQLLTEIGDKFGGDLFAINVQRGRDHGIASYNKYRQLCGLARVSEFWQLHNEISPPIIEKLEKAYSSVHDIDLYAGGLAEKPVPGGEVGPTFACILAYGFRALRKGDRYWHEHEFSPSPFTQQQLVELRKTTYANILCETGEGMEYVWRQPLLQPKSSALTSCFGSPTLPKLDISPWRSGYESASSQSYQYEWTVWFPTDFKFNSTEVELNMPTLVRRIRSRRPEEMCPDSDRMDFDVRWIASFAQVRFMCKAGTVDATDFPRELSDKTYWSSWVVPMRQFGSDQTAYVTDFHCGKVLAIQAMANGKFARETGDVFQDYGVTNGFVCRDHHQPRGECYEYKVRALCARSDGTGSESPEETVKISTFDTEPIKLLQIPVAPRQVPTMFGPFPIQPDTGKRPRVFSTHVDGFSMKTAALYCNFFGVCCDNGVRFPSRSFIPINVARYARIKCAQYGICCEAGF